MRAQIGCKIVLFIQVKILAAMCNDLLSTAPLRTELDKREENEQVIAGQGGEGGSIPMRTPEERAQRQAAVSLLHRLEA